VRRMTLVPVLAGPAILLAAGYAVTVVAPATAKANTHRTDQTTTYTVGAVKGHRLYAANGCVYCHSLARRDAYTDAGLAPAKSGPDERLNDDPALMGQARYGPDLTCAGDRVPGAAAGADENAKVAAMVAYLQDPAAFHHGTTMPSYRVLRIADLQHLAQYLVEQTCAQEATP
jgi:cbb3-type cytochrome oxidase cytochrome c subunit